jgi:hypothetical protein
VSTSSREAGDAGLRLGGAAPPSKVNGRVTTPDGQRAERRGDPGHHRARRRCPCRRPRPAVTKTMSAPLSTSSISSRVVLRRLAADLGIARRRRARGSARGRRRA